MGKLTLNDVVSGYTSTSAINANNDLTEVALENTLSRDGTTPNSMAADLDMNGYAVINHLASSGDLNFSFKGDWGTGSDYIINNLLYVTTSESATNGGATYISTTNHTSGATFDGDLSANWKLFSKRGASGPGSGDLLSTNNLGDVGDASTSRTNLGVAIGSDVQAYDTQLDDIAALAITADNFIVADGVNWVAESGATARTSLGLTDAILDKAAPGEIGSRTPAAATFTALTSNGIDDNASGTRFTLGDSTATFNTNIDVEDDNSAANVSLTIHNTNAIGTGAGVICEYNSAIKGAIGYSKAYDSMVIQSTLGGAGKWFAIDVSTGDATFSDNVNIDPGGKLTVDRTTEDAAFINFKATADADATSAVSTLTTSGSTTHHIQVEINGTTAWIAVSTTDPT